MNIILVTAIWCPSCIIMRPRYQKLFEKIKTNYKSLNKQTKKNFRRLF